MKYSYLKKEKLARNVVLKERLSPHLHHHRVFPQRVFPLGSNLLFSSARPYNSHCIYYLRFTNLLAPLIYT